MPTPTTPPSMTPVPTPQPVRNDRSTFSPRVDAFVTWVPTFLTELAAVLTNAYNNAVSAYNSAAAALSSQNAAAVSVTDAQDQVDLAAAQVALAAAQAAAAASSAASANLSPYVPGTSTTSLTIGAGSKNLTIQTGKNIVSGMFMIVSPASAPTYYMHGIVESYDTGTGALTIFVSRTAGSGTYASWVVSLSAPEGADTGPIYADTTVSLVENRTHLLDSTAGGFTATLPPAPVAGDMIELIDPRSTWAQNPVTIDRNGKNIVDAYGSAQAENLTLNQSGARVTVFFDGTNWRLI